MASLAARQSGIGLNLTYVDDGFDQVGRGLFDPKYMNALYDYGMAQGRSKSRFRNGLMPGRASPTASSGSSGDAAPK